MTRTHVANLLARIGIAIVISDAHGIVTRRWKCSFPQSWSEELWRLETGSGIAGNSAEWWLVPLREGFGQKLGPYRIQRTLAAALRRWRRWQ